MGTSTGTRAVRQVPGARSSASRGGHQGPAETACAVRLVDRRPVAVSVEITGEIDVAGRHVLGRLLETLSGAPPDCPLVVDLTGVTFADSTLSWLLTELEVIAGAAETCVRVAGAGAGAMRLLHLLDFDRLAVHCLCPQIVR